MHIRTAALKGNLEAVRAAIKRGDDVNSVDEGGCTALTWAARCGHTDIVKELLSSGAATLVDLAAKDGSTALIRAAEGGHTDIVRELLSSGANVDLANEDRDTALMRAAWEGHTDSAKELLSSGATLDLADEYGNTALIQAAEGGHTNIVRELLSSGATVDLASNDGTTALIQAAKGGHTDTVRELLSSGASVGLVNEEGKTALDVAKESQHPNPTLICLLKSLGAVYAKSLSAQSAPILPWTAVTDKETEKKLNKAKAEEKVFTPPGYPLLQTSTHPDVTFYDEPQQKEFTSSGGSHDFNNGVEVTVPPNTVKAGSSVNIKVQPSLAPKDVFLMPDGIRSASPSYLLSSKGTDVGREITVTMEHHVRVITRGEADDLLFLQADSVPKRTGSGKCMYEYQEVPESRSEFIPGENKGRLTTRHFSRKFFKVGFRNRLKKWITGRKVSGETKGDDSPKTEEEQASDNNLYTVRVYRSPPHTTGDKMAIICVSLFGTFYSKFLEVLDNEVIPRDYPEVSIRAADRTTIGSLQFVQVFAKLNIHPLQGWSVEPDKKIISKMEVNQPETENYKPKDLHDYPPKIVCRIFPEENAPKRATATLTLIGIEPDVEVSIPLKAPKVQAVVDTTKLQEAADNLKSTALQVSDSQLGSTVDSVLSLIDRMTIALKSLSLSDLAVHTESIKIEIETVLKVSRRVAEECSRPTISENIGVSVSKMEALSHQLCQVTKVKLKHCQDESEEISALLDLVESGASLLRTIDCLLKDIQTLSGFSRGTASPGMNISYDILVKLGDKIVESISHAPKRLALHLLSAGFISHSILEKTNELNETKREKATRLYTAVLSVIRAHPHKFKDFMTVLKEDHSLYGDLIHLLESTYSDD